MIPIFSGLGYVQLLLNSIIAFFYNLIITYCVYYFIISIRAELPWSDCNGVPDCFKANLSIDCDLQKQPFIKQNSKFWLNFKNKKNSI